MQGRNVRFQGKYDSFMIYPIPSVTISLISFDSWTGASLSIPGNRTGNKLLLAVWGFAAGIYYCMYARYLFHIGRYGNPGGRTLMYTAATFLLMTVMVPYMPRGYPLKADLHVLLAFFSPMLLAFSIIGFPRLLGSHDRMRFRGAWGILWTIVICSVFFLLEADSITSFLGIFIITGLRGYLRCMEQLLTT